MTGLPSGRLAGVSGMVLAAVVALWWLGRARLAIDGGSGVAVISTQALQAAWLVRGIVLALLTVRVGAWHGWRAGAAAAVALIAPSWPVVALAWLATDWPWTSLVLAESLLLAAGCVLPLIGLALRGALSRAELADLLAAGVGVALATVAWLTPTPWAT